MAAVVFTMDGTTDKPYGNTSVTTGAEQEIDLLIAAGALCRQRVQLYTDQDIYMSLTAGGTATPNNCEIIPGGSFRNIDVSGLQGQTTIALGGGKAIYLLALTATANVRISAIRAGII